ncbi:TetR/AcrR family transcriptional regulator [Lysobacter brunescens]|uniref:TetR/AcrR family transcriptional regulator n=1 Tax=Lysobacter brunescens TaxID=262323 RepID=A0ABW2Y9C4_9GAMM
MSTKDRRLRERAEREQRFLDKAQELIQRDGLLSLQMSRIAEECDYAIGTLYQHFASKEDLLVTLATRNCLSRVGLFERAARWSGPSRERIVSIALADLMVIRAQPEHFRLAQFVWTEVIWGAASAETRRRSLDASAPLGALVDGIVESAQACGDLPTGLGLTPQALTLGPWTLCLGMHTLTHTEGLLEAHALSDPYRLLMKHLHYLLNGYGWQPLFDPSDDGALDALNARLCRDVFDTHCPNACRPMTARAATLSSFPEASPHD